LDSQLGIENLTGGSSANKNGVKRAIISDFDAYFMSAKGCAARTIGLPCSIQSR
jgi:hypothetical protein